MEIGLGRVGNEQLFLWSCLQQSEAYRESLGEEVRTASLFPQSPALRERNLDDLSRRGWGGGLCEVVRSGMGGGKQILYEACVFCNY